MTQLILEDLSSKQKHLELEVLARQGNQKSAPSSLSRSPTPGRFNTSHLASRVSEGERRVSPSWLACTLTLDRWVPKWTPSLRYFGAPSCFVSPLWIQQADT